jgi:hypothetical protein
MIRTKFEKDLQEQLSELSINFDERVYHEDLLLALNMNLIGKLKKKPGSSDYDVKSNGDYEIHFFRRVSSYKGKTLIYDTYTHKNSKEFSDDADDIIKNGDYTEGIFLRCDGKTLIDFFPKDINQKNVQVISKSMNSRFEAGDRRLSLNSDPFHIQQTLVDLRKLNNTAIDRNYLCRRLVGFLLIEDLI